MCIRLTCKAMASDLDFISTLALEAEPKSMRTASPLSLSIMFPGLTSLSTAEKDKASREVITMHGE